MSVRVTTDAAEFQAAVFPFLEGDPVLNTVLLGNVHQRARGLRIQEAPPVFVSVHDTSGAVVGAAMRTDGRGIFLGALRDELVPEVFEAYAARTPEAPYVTGTSAASLAFAELWSARFGKPFAEGRGTRLHRLGTIADLTAEGRPRPAAAADAELCVDWVAAFEREVSLPEFPDRAARVVWATDEAAAGRLWLWEHGGRATSMVAYHAPLFGVSRVGPVYTPPDLRGRGYAGALTSTVSRQILDDGGIACLYTDLANPTSNKIYAAIGYEPLADFVDYTFT
jgi:GNAT superfamily N-acetyltransferase